MKENWIKLVKETTKKKKVATNLTCPLFSKSMTGLKFCKARNLRTFLLKKHKHYRLHSTSFDISNISDQFSLKKN